MSPKTPKKPTRSAKTPVSSPAPLEVPLVEAPAPRTRRPRAASGGVTPAVPAARKPAAKRVTRPRAAEAVPVPAAEVRAVRLVTDDDIRVRAYFLSIEHRGQGSPEYFWFLAEQQLRRRAD